MKKLSPEFLAKAKKKCKVPCIILACVLVVALIATIFVLCTKDKTPEPELVYDDPLTQLMMGNPVDSDDYDYDQVPNELEISMKTDPYNADTDGDGLGDYYEIEHSKTDPLKVDTDGDTLSDLVEVRAGLDPLKTSTDGETPDAERTFSETYNKDNVKVAFTGDANLYRVYCAPFEVSGLAQTPGVMSTMIEVYIDGKLPKAELTFSYKDKDVTNRGGVEADLAVYEFTKDGKFVKMENSVLDTDKNTVYCGLQKSGRYILCDSSVTAEHKNQIMLLIDNSGSMFPPEVSEGSSGNDVDFKRLDMAKSIIENISENTSYGLAKFTGTYTQMCGLATSKETLFEQIDSIRDIDEVFNGTYIATSIIKSLDNFTESHNSDRKFVIILTDGASTEHSGLLGFLSGNPTEYDVVKKCNAKNVTVIAIALGNEIDAEYLQTIANGTGGAYIYANNADALEDVYDAVFKSLIYSAEDWNNDDKTDSFIVADSGFDMERNGFAFENLAILAPNNSTQQHGLCYGMAMLAQGYYRNINLGTGSAFDAVKKYKHYDFYDYDIRAALNNASNLHDVKCEIAEKWTELHLIEKKDRYVCADGVLMYKPELLEKYTDKYFTVQTYEVSGTFGNQKYQKAQMLYIDLDKYLESDETRADMEIVKALYWLWGSQPAVAGESLLSVKTFNLNNSWGDTATESEFNKLAEVLKRGVPLTISYTSPAGGHAINAMRLLRDAENPLVYYLECYDNNDCKEPYIFKIERSDIDFWTSTSVSNWGENYCYKTYLLNNGKWTSVSLEFSELK